MGTFGFLILNDLKKFKNYIFEIKKKPWKLVIYLLYIAWFGIILSTAFGGNSEIPDIPNFEFRLDIFSVIIKVLVFLLFAFTLYSSSKNFDGLFSMGDVNFLFPSPISPRIILAYSMVKQSFVVSFSSIFIVFLFPLLQTLYGPISPGAIAYSLVGVIVLFVFSVPFSYLTFVLSTRFGLREWLQYFLYAIVLFILGAVTYGIYIHHDVVEGLFWAFNHPIFPYIPIVGWSAELIGVSVFGISSLSNIFLVLQLLTIAIITFFAIFLAQDYYEDTLPSAEQRAEIKRYKKEGKTVSLSSIKGTKKKVRQVTVKEVGQGPWAFLWMQLVGNKRASGSLFFQWKTLGLAIASIAFGLLIPEKSSMVFYILAGGIAYITFLSSMSISIEQELKMKYIFILPGEPWKKILALNIVPVIKTIIFMSCALLPAGIIFRVPVMALLAGVLFPVSMSILNLFSSVIIRILIPSNFDMKAFYPVIRIFSFLLFLVPPAIAGISVGIFTKNVALAFYSIAVINIAMSILFLGISDRVFYKLEIR